MKETVRNKKLHIELLRIIAIFFVIFNHTGSNGFYMFASEARGTFAYGAYMFLSVLCKFAVPLFLAISGGLLLSRDESLKDILKKRVLRIVIVLLAFSVLYYVYKFRGNWSGMSIKGFIKSLYQGQISGAYWYLYVYIAFLLTIPFLRSLVKNLEKKYFYYLFAIALFFDSILPLAEYVVFKGHVTMSNWLKISWLISMAVINPIVGYYIENVMDVSKAKKCLPFMWIIAICGLICTCLVTDLYATVVGTMTEAADQPFHYCFSTFLAATVYVTCKVCFSLTKTSQPQREESLEKGMPVNEGAGSREDISKPKQTGNSFGSKVLTFLGGAVFGTYLTHMFFLDVLYYRIIPFLTGLGINKMAAAYIFTFAIMVLGMIAARVMKLIPGVKKLL